MKGDETAQADDITQRNQPPDSDMQKPRDSRDIVVASTSSTADPTLFEVAMSLKVSTITSTVHVALLGFHWMKFLALLMIAIAMLLRKGPEAFVIDQERHRVRDSDRA